MPRVATDIDGQGGKSRAERYLEHLDELSGGSEPRFLRIESSHPGLKSVTVITYVDLPEPGHLTAITYGLSLADHPDWRQGKPELCISVQSTDVDWAMAMGFLAERLRGQCPFTYGNTVDLGEPVTPDTAMTAFVVFAPISLEREDATDIDVGDDLPINIKGLYPVHESERQYIRANGLEPFWHLDWDPYDTRRAAVV
jgi:hypothetical protein